MRIGIALGSLLELVGTKKEGRSLPKQAGDSEQIPATASPRGELWASIWLKTPMGNDWKWSCEAFGIGMGWFDGELEENENVAEELQWRTAELILDEE